MPEKVSVLLPTRNRVTYLRQALSSIQHQRGVELEILVCDDGSSDSTAHFLEQAARQDPRIRWIRFERSNGVAVALNSLIALSHYPWLARMDDDDVAYPERLALLVQYMQTHRLDVCGTWYRRVAGWRRSIARPAIEHERIVGELLFQPPLLHPSVMMRREIFDYYGGYACDACYAEDYELWVRLLSCVRFGNCPRVLMDYRLSRHQVSHQKNSAQIQTARLLRVCALQKLGIRFSEEEARIHAHLRDPEPITALAELRRIHDWLTHLHIQLDPLAQQAVRRQWFLQAVRAAGLGRVVFKTYDASPLAEPTLIQRRLLWNLCALRLRYRSPLYNTLEPLAGLG